MPRERMVASADKKLSFHDLISAQGQFFGGFHAALAVGIEHVGFLGWITAAGIDHGPVSYTHLDVYKRQLLQCAYDKYKGDRTTLRDIVVLELLFSTGLRVSELCSLTNENFDLKESSARFLINGKGRKERIIQLTTPELISLLHVYCDAYKKEISGGRSILYNRDGRPLSTQSVRRIITRYLRCV